MEGVKGALDYQNEWWFNSQTKELFVQMPNGSAPSNGAVQMRRRKVTIDLSGRSYVHIKNLAVFGGSIDMPRNSNNNLIYGVSSFYGNHILGVQKGFSANKQSVLLEGNNNIVERCEIAFGAANGIKVGGDKNKIINSRIHDFNYLGSYDAPINARGGKNTLFKDNTIFRGGRDGIQFFNNNSEFSYNDISEANLINDDSALLYTVGGPHNGKIHHNWFHDNEGRGKLRKAAGIYLDNDAEAFSVHHNVVWNVEWTGVQINWNGKDIDVFNNTLVKTKGGAMGAWHKEGTSFSNVKVWNNIADVKTEDDPSTQEDEGTFERDADKQNNVITKSGYTNYDGNKFTLRSNSPAVNAGRTISGITDGFVGSAPDVGAYEFGGENWIPGIKWNSSLGPTGNGCYGLPGESCSDNNIEDLVEFANPPTVIQSQLSYDVQVKYSAKVKREIVVEFWSSTSWLGQKEIEVEAGERTVNVTLDLPTAPAPGTGYIYKLHIRPINTTWEDAIDRDQVNNVTVTAPFTQLIINGSYQIESTQSNQRLLSRASEQHSAIMSNPYTFNDQVWVFDHKGDNVYTIRNLATNRFLEIPYARCGNGENVATWTDAEGDHQIWKVIQNGSNTFSLKPMHCVARALDRAAGAIDANVQIWDFNSKNNNQKWKIVSLNNRKSSTEEKGKTLSVYPNPSKQEITVEGAKANDIVIIYDLMGKIIKKTKLTTDDESLIISDMESGLYILSVFGKNKVQFIKY